MQRFAYDGIWWLPDKPELKVSGTLTFSPDEGATLDLIGSFRDPLDFKKLSQPDIILGISANGKQITLHRCIETNISASFPLGFQTSRFHAQMIFIGAHFQRFADIKFSSISVHYTHLDAWTNISGFNFEILPNRTMDIKYKMPESIKTSINDDYTVEINFQVTGPAFHAAKQEVNIQQKTYIIIQSKEERSFDELSRIMYQIRNFLSLGIKEAVYPLHITGKGEARKTMIKDTPYYEPIEIIYKLINTPMASKEKLPFQMLFVFEDIKGKFETFLRNWFVKTESLEPVYDLYFGTLYNPRMYLQHRFLSLVHALESYHRRTMKNYELPEDQHNRRIQEILNAVPTEQREWLESRLTYSNEPSLRRRLREIFSGYSDVLNEYIENKDAFMNKVVVTRNYLTHYDPNLEEDAADGEELYHISEKLRLLIEICLLTELGFDPSEIKHLLSRNETSR